MTYNPWVGQETLFLQACFWVVCPLL